MHELGGGREFSGRTLVHGAIIVQHGTEDKNTRITEHVSKRGVWAKPLARFAILLLLLFSTERIYRASG